MRSGAWCHALSLVLLSGLVGVAPASADWVGSGLPLSLDHASTLAGMVTDGAGGAIATWEDAGHGPRVQRVSGDGTPLWTAGGVSLSAFSSRSPAIVSDGSSGAIVVWEDDRLVPFTGPTLIYAQRLDAGGVPQWLGSASLQLSYGAGNFWSPIAFPDGSGGAVVGWRGPSFWYFQRVDHAGVLQWGSGGVTFFPSQSDVQFAPDGTGGVVGVTVAATGFEAQDIIAQRIDGTGGKPWGPSGISVTSNGLYIEDDPVVAPDGAGGAVVAWDDDSPANSTRILAQRINSSGVATWPSPVVVSAIAAIRPAIVAAGGGRTFIVWEDYRDVGKPDHLFGQLLDDLGAPQWTQDGLAICTARGEQINPVLATDASGGLTIAWQDARNYVTWDVYAQRVNAGGSVQWAANGIQVCPAHGEHRNPAIVAAAAGAAIIAWDDARVPVADVYAAKVGSDGVVPTLASLIDASADPSRVRLTWYAEGAVGLKARVERSAGGSSWNALGLATAQGSNRLVFEDRDVAPGARYGYRLMLESGGSEAAMGEAWVDVPRAAGFALEGLRPNPAVRELHAAFSLTGGAPASLELLDLAGRQVLERPVDDLGAGHHVIDVAGASVPPGIYLLRLREGAHTATAKAVVMP